jgi:hypothetical protein
MLIRFFQFAGRLDEDYNKVVAPVHERSILVDPGADGRSILYPD